VRRVSRTLEAMTGSLDRLLGFLVADPEMSGDAVHHDPLRCVGAGLPLGCQFLDSLAEPIGQARTCARTLRHTYRVWVDLATVDYSPTESVTHFLVKLVFAAPASFLSLAAVSHAVLESV
jgi:hypothetical protein